MHYLSLFLSFYRQAAYLMRLRISHETTFPSESHDRAIIKNCDIPPPLLFYLSANWSSIYDSVRHGQSTDALPGALRPCNSRNFPSGDTRVNSDTIHHSGIYLVARARARTSSIRTRRINRDRDGGEWMRRVSFRRVLSGLLVPGRGGCSCNCDQTPVYVYARICENAASYTVADHPQNEGDS